MQGEHCVAHLTDSEFAAEIARLHNGGALDARGVTLSAKLLQALLDQLRANRNSSPQIPRADFTDARFSGDADFDRVQFSGRADFWAAEFFGPANFDEARFCSAAVFTGAQFSNRAEFAGAQFSNPAVFTGAHFSNRAEFGGAQFYGADFGGARFSGLGDFGGARFSGPADFDRARFSGPAVFTCAHFGGAAGFRGAVFERRGRIGPLVVSGALVFDEADFQQDVELNVSAGEVWCRWTRFGGRADLNVRWAEVALDNATFVGRSRLAGVGDFADVDEKPAQLRRDDRQLDASARPRLVSLRCANVENLALGNIDLRACRFFGAHALDELRIEADCEFPQPPRHRRYTRRRTLAEEHHWQAQRAAPAPASSRASGWHPSECQPPQWLKPAAEVLDPARIAGLYRALRKALEDRNDEPGAADFYYGEMQMRRYAARAASRARDRGERWLLALYWLTSGYALRASRAFASLVVTIVLFAVLFHAVGFRDPAVQTRVRTVSPRGTLVYERVAPAQHSTAATELLDAAIYSAGTATSVIGAPERQLTRAGSVLRIILRVLGPILIGLTLLSIRGRVKR